ncbi:ABC transporter ATP-binding protein [Streptomyces sp. NPDC050625]|uniref:ABC transporter ATP-binding protein n=1 Tax=Streptomyces sp. NPDC050625 TaxID=3154629 RepID=UPI0034241C4C
MTTIGSVLSVRHLSARIGTSQILHGVDLEVPRNQTTVILGRNGVGKTTLLRSILGYVEASGHIELLGHPIDRLPTHKRVRAGIAYVPEDRDVFRSLTVEENLRLAERAGQVPRYDLVFDLFPDLADRRSQNAGSLSGGQQQMVALGRGLLSECELLIVDEPTKGLSPRVVQEVVDVLARVKEGVTILMVEQNLSAAQQLADDVVVISEGTVVASGTGEMLVDRDKLRGFLGVGRSEEV